MNIRCSLAVLLFTVGAAAQLPITRVILYKSGVGAIERTGTLTSDSSAQLTFRAGAMNDVLKSLTVTDQSGGRITDVRFRADEPLSRQLEDYPFHLTRGAPLLDLLNQLQGARVAVQQGSMTLSGTIVGASSRTAEKGKTTEQVTLLLDDGTLRSLDLDSLNGVRLLDPALQAQLQEYLSHLAASRSDKQRTLHLELTGKTPQKLTVRYIESVPVWKTTWRLVLRGTQPSLLEGWAIVNNTSSDDWRNVHLALVSGRPVSFISPLFEPDYVRRAYVRLPDEQALTPVEGLQSDAKTKPASEYESSAGLRGVLGGVLGGIPSAAPPPPPQYAVPSGINRDAAGFSSVTPEVKLHRQGALFTYTLSQPVTIGRGQAAMVPVLQQPIKAERVMVYSSRTGTHPRVGVRLSNSTGVTLDGGPVLVYDGNAYAGEGLIGTMPGGDERLVDYASAQDVSVEPRAQVHRSSVQELHASDGILYATWPVTSLTVYHIENAGAKAATLTLEHPSRQGITLVSPKPVRQAAGHFEFRIPLTPHSRQDFTVTERSSWKESIALASASEDTVQKYLHEKALNGEGRRQLGDLLQKMRERDRVNAEADTTRKTLSDLADTQDRLRKNIDSLNRVSGEQVQVKAYAAELARQESQFLQLHQKLDRLQQQAGQLSSEIGDAIATLKF